MIIKVKVIPKSSFNKIVGFEGEILKVKIKALPEKNRANEELIAFLAKKLNISKKSIKIIAGETFRIKSLSISGIEEPLFKEKILS